MRVTCIAESPQGLPDVMTLEPGAQLGDMVMVAVGAPERHGVYSACYQCDKGFANGVAAVVAHRPTTEEVDAWAFHDRCAERYRDECQPIVVTVHEDGTATLTGPTGVEVTMVADFLGATLTLDVHDDGTATLTGPTGGQVEYSAEFPEN
jgi:hypothetical protein